MEITDVRAHPVSMKLRDRSEGGNAPYVTNHNELTSVDRVIVEVRTDEGITGWGEVRVFFTPKAAMSLIEDGVGPLVTGRSPFEVETFRRSYFMEFSNQTDVFFAPVEIACWDIIGQSLGKPIYELLGGWTAPASESRRRDASYDVRQRVDLSYCAGILPPSEAVTQAKRVAAAGYEVMQVKGGRDWQQDVEAVVAIHDEVGSDVEIRLDPNQGWSLDQAVRVAASLEDRGVYLQFLEQPVRVDSHESLAQLRRRTRQPIAANEDTYYPHNLRRLIQLGAVDAVAVDMTPLGGISGLRKAAGIVEDAGGIGMMHHCAFDLGVRTAAILHAVTGIPGFTLPMDTAYFAWEDDVIDTQLTISDGTIAVPDGPGLGVTVDRDALERYRIPSDESSRIYGA